MDQSQAVGLTNLPARRPSLIGREEEAASVRQRLLEAEAGLLTLTGAGGCGKTSLAVHAARDLLDHFPAGIWLVQLAPLSDPALVPQAVASVLGVREGAGRTLLDALVAALQPRTLVLLDNCEHLIDACARLAEVLLEACPELRILATSREPLHIGGEVTWRVPSLAAPDPRRPASPDELAGYPAVRLFVERAKAVQDGFALRPDNAAAVARICARLEGLPLALELAATRVRAMAVEQLGERLEGSFDLLGAGSRTAPTRQQTLRATLDWSHALLSDEERALFRCLAVFAGGWSLEAAEAICAGARIEPPQVLDVLTRLIDKSLVLAEEQHGQARYRLLEPIRQYAMERLQQSSEEGSTRQRHAAYYLALAEQAGTLWLAGPEQVAWLGRLEQEHNNLRAALGWSSGRPDKEGHLRLAVALVWFWKSHGPLDEGRRWLEAALAHRGSGSVGMQARLVHAAALIAHGHREDARVIELLEEAVRLAMEAGDTALAAYGLDNLGHLAGRRGDYVVAQDYYEQSLALYRALGDPKGVAMEVANLGLNARWRGDHAAAGPLLEEGLALTRAVGNTQSTAIILVEQAALALAEGDAEQVAALASESLRLLRAQKSRWDLPECLELLAAVASIRAQPERAARLYGAAEAVRAVDGLPPVHADRAVAARQVAAIRAVLGEVAFAAAWSAGREMPVEQAIEEALAGGEPTPAAAPARPAAGRRAGPLTAREREVAALIAQGLTNRQIAEALVITEGTVSVHVEHILGKLDAHSRAQVAAWATAHDLLAEHPA